MVDTEIWLRLMSISSLYGDDMVRIAQWLAKQSHIDAVVLQQTGLTLRQAQRFLSFPRKSIESSLCWLEQPNHHLIPCGQRILSSSTSGDDRLPRRTVC